MNRVLTWCLLLSGEAALAALVAATFWYQDWQYSLPTPRPAALVQPALGETIELPELGSSFPDTRYEQRPTLLHFFNPSCPCSRFNLQHLRELIRQFQGQVKVIAVLQATDEASALAEFQQLAISCRAVVDKQGELAHRFGVYSTPQAVILDVSDKLYYRGNYNRSRYCTEPESEFVRLALVACLAKEPLPVFSADAAIAQGCALPADLVLKQEAAP